MPSKKIFAISIVCVAVIFSVWVIQDGTVFNAFQKNTNAIAVGETSSTEKNADWQKLMSAGASDTTITDVTTKAATELESTVTGQIAGDFLARYMAAKNQITGQVTEEQANQIAADTLASGNYTNIIAPQYTLKDINANQISNKELLLNYKNELISIMEKRAPKNVVDVATVTQEALESQNESVLNKLDPIISSTQATILDMLKISVPKNMVNIHLELINALSNLLEDTKAMKNSFSDPIKAYVVVSSYDEHAQNLNLILQRLDNYFQ